MYEWVPFLHGTYYTYTEYAAGIAFAIFLVLGLLNLLISFLIKLCTKLSDPAIPHTLYQMEKRDYLMNQHAPHSGYVQNPYQGSHSLQYLEQQLEESGIANWFINFFNWAGVVFLAMAPVGLSFFGVLLSPLASALLMFSHFFVKIRSVYHTQARKLYDTLRHANTIAYAQEASSAKSSYRSKLIFFLVFSFAFSYTLSGGCIAFYEDYVGLKLEHFDLSVSTALTRFIQLSDACPHGAPCHVYATLPEDASTGVFINFHTHIDVDHENIQVLYDTEDYFQANNKLRYNQTVSTNKLDFIEQRGRRAVHTALLDGLTPETRYYVQIQYDGAVQKDFDYVTLPDKTSQKDIIISTGGDLGDRTIAKQITLQAGSVNPDVIVIGGDVAYDDGEYTCYFTWDNFFKSFALSTLTTGRLVPFLFSTGNHDFGLNPLSGRNIDTNKNLYTVFLPQNTVPGVDENKNPINKVPAVHERTSFHYHLFSNILHLNLDTGYLASPQDQAEFISTLSMAFPEYIKMVSHHNPIYKACAGDRDQVEDDAKDLWVPLFDKFNFMVIFENHEHAFKKTFPLTDSKPAENGVFYVGNGNWGAKPSTPTCKPNNSTGVLEYSSRINHYWLCNVSVSQGIIQYTPFNAQGVPLIDTFTQEISKYVSDEDRLIE